MPRFIPSKAVRLIPMLGSPADHEALAAVRALGRVLDGAGLGFTDLAAAISAEDTDTEQGALSRRPDNLGAGAQIRPFDVYAWRRAYTPRQEQEHRSRVRYCQNRAHRLTEWERGFVNNVARLHGNLSIRQGDRLAVIVDRIGREARHA